MKNVTLILVLALSLLLTACGGSGGALTADDGAGKDLFTQSTIGSQAGCATCHSLEPGIVIIGPSVAGVGTRAATQVAGQSVEEYLKESITAPDAYLSEGFPASVMPQSYAQELTAEQIDQLVAFLMTLN